MDLFCFIRSLSSQHWASFRSICDLGSCIIRFSAGSFILGISIKHILDLFELFVSLAIVFIDSDSWIFVCFCSSQEVNMVSCWGHFFINHWKMYVILIMINWSHIFLLKQPCSFLGIEFFYYLILIRNIAFTRCQSCHLIWSLPTIYFTKA